MKLTDYTWTTGYKYFPLTRTFNNGSTRVENYKKWSMTIHENSCRYAPKRNYPGYVGELGFQALATQGFAVSHSWDTVWRGCKVCGTASISEDDWKRMARKHLDTKQLAQATQRALDRERWRVEDLRRQYEQAQKDAVNVWLTTHEAEIQAVRTLAARIWLDAHPDDAKDVEPQD